MVHRLVYWFAWPIKCILHNTKWSRLFCSSNQFSQYWADLDRSKGKRLTRPVTDCLSHTVSVELGFNPDRPKGKRSNFPVTDCLSHTASVELGFHPDRSKGKRPNFPVTDCLSHTASVGLGFHPDRSKGKRPRSLTVTQPVLNWVSHPDPDRSKGKRSNSPVTDCLSHTASATRCF